MRVAYWLHERLPGYKIGDYLASHKELVTVNGSWYSANTLEVLLFLHARADDKLDLSFVENLRERLSGKRLDNPDLLVQPKMQCRSDRYVFFAMGFAKNTSSTM